MSEVFSEPSLSVTAKKMGMKAGSSFDLKTGYDLKHRTERRRCWKQEDPDLVLVCPPCGPFSCLQNWNYPKMRLEKAIVLLGDGIEHLRFSMDFFEWQCRRGKNIFEHPSTSRVKSLV